MRGEGRKEDVQFARSTYRINLVVHTNHKTYQNVHLLVDEKGPHHHPRANYPNCAIGCSPTAGMKGNQVGDPYILKTLQVGDSQK